MDSNNPDVNAQSQLEAAFTEEHRNVPNETPAQDNFSRNVDPNTLPPELLSIYKNMQGDYTRKMQEIAGYRNLGDLNTVQQYVSFVNNLQTNQDFARSVYGELGSLLGEQGGYEEPEVFEVDDDEYGYDEEPDNHLQVEMSQLKAWAANIEQERATSRVDQMMAQQESQILRDNPEYTPQDMEAIYQLAFSHDGNLVAAQQTYNNLQSRWAQAYLGRKATVPSAFKSQPFGSSSAEAPNDKFKGLSDPRLEDAVNRYIAGVEGY